MRFTIDTKKTIPENAEHYYMEAKKAQKKIDGAKKALEETLKKKKELKETLNRIQEEEKEPEKKEKKQKRWYETYRWFKSSDGFLIVGGRDASTNETLIKKHTEKEDVVFHADIQGAPFFVIKNPEKKDIPEKTLQEAAEAAASYSKAWQAGWGNCDVYYVKPEQVTKTTKAGEYITKGAFMIYGKKNWFKATKLGIAVGYTPDEGIISGPVTAVEKKTRCFAKIIPGQKKSKELAEEIKELLIKNAEKEDAKKIKDIRIDEIQRLIPAGRGRLK